MASIRGFFRRVAAGAALNRLASRDNLEKVFNILEDLEGVNCRIEKPTGANGRGWRIVVDGTSDTMPPDGEAPPWQAADEGGGGAGGLPWAVSATPNDDGTFGLSMVRGRYLAAADTSPAALPLSIRLSQGSLPSSVSASGYVTLSVNARYNEDTKKFTGIAGEVSYAAEVGSSGTYANIPVAHVTIYGGAATVEQYLVGTIILPMPPPLKAVAGAVRGVDYNAGTSALTKTTGVGVAFDDTDTTQSETLFTAVDEEI